MAISPLKRIHIDYAEFKKIYYFIIVDAYSKWLEVYITGKTTTYNTIKYLKEFINRYSIPVTIVNDNGPQFRSNEFKEFCKEIKIQHKNIPTYHRQTNGLAKRYVKVLKK